TKIQKIKEKILLQQLYKFNFIHYNKNLIFTLKSIAMNKETLKQHLVEELKRNNIMLYADRQAFKKDKIPKDYIEKQLIRNKRQKKLSFIAFGVLIALMIVLQFYIVLSENAIPFLQNISVQFMPMLGVLFFQANHQNFGKRIFILELLRDWEKE
ncbi:MAG: hypothetical protein JW857_04605, partial [Bacteroidales bacterium]|nr:hypothetical protein [Bacteroidales bacterium]